MYSFWEFYYFRFCNLFWQVSLPPGKMNGETGRHLVSTLPFKSFHVIDLFLWPLKSGKKKMMLFCFLHKYESLEAEQPSRDVHSKRCSENMQQIDRITPTPKFNFNKFALGVLLKICCIVSKHLFLRTPLHGCSWMIVTGVA